jgi:hypothetical protein
MHKRFPLTALGLSLVLIGVLLLSSVPHSVSAKRATNADGTDSPDISESGKQQILALIAEKESRTPEQRKIASTLLRAIREHRGETMAPGVTSMRAANVGQAEDGSLEVDITAIVTDELLSELETMGVQVISSYPQYQRIRARTNLNLVERIAHFSEVKFIRPAVKAMKSRASTGREQLPTPAFAAPRVRPGFAERAANVRRQVKEAMARAQQDNSGHGTNVGSILSQGDRAHRADDLRATYGYQGQGIRIGVLSDSFNATGTAPADVTSGNLPGPGNPNGNTTPVTVVEEISVLTDGSDEGRAMLQIVHDLAPKAQLYFASAFNGDAAFANAIQTLRNAPNNCDIIIDDIFYYNETPFQDAIIAQAVNTVTASGAMYFSSAGNEGNIAKGTSGYWEGDFQDGGTLTIAGNTKTGTVHNFGVAGAKSDLSQNSNGDLIGLFWSDPLGNSTNDYDVFIMNNALTTVFDSSTDIQSVATPGDPIELTAGPIFNNERVVVFKETSAAVRALSVNTFRGKLQTATTGQTHGHSSAVDAYSVAAVDAGTAYPNAFSAANPVETFTSDGPRRVFFTAAGAPITPGNVLFGTNGGTVRAKPDVTAADGVSTTLPPTSGLNPFFGTSAAAPHAGAIAALLKSGNPSLTPAQIRTILTTTALDVEGAGYDNISGFGIVQAFQAMTSVSPVPMAGLNTGSITITEGSFSNLNGLVEPGETANIVVPMLNPSAVTAANVQATLSLGAPTAGVKVKGSYNYGNIPSSGNASNTSTPFKVLIARNVPTPSTVPLVLNVSLGGGTSPISFNFNLNVAAPTVTLINQATTLDASAPAGGSTGSQTGRIVRTGVPSTCAAPKTNPGLTAITGARRYDAYTFTNSTGATRCYTVNITDGTGGQIGSVAYTAAGFVPATPNTNYLADHGVVGNIVPYSFSVANGQSFTVVIHDINVGVVTGLPYSINVSYALTPSPPTAKVSDFNVDSKSDVAVFRPSDGNWYYRNSQTGFNFATVWGGSGDKPVPGDYDGDGQTDLAVYRPSEGNWYIINSFDGTVTVTSWGAAGDKPVPADYDGDGQTDIAVYRPSEGNWYIRKSGGGTTTTGWGAATDKLVPGDYDGDGKADIAVYRPSEGNWYIVKSTGGTTIQGWGASGDIVVPADYDGDKKTDIAVWRPSEGNWYIIKSSGGTTVTGWGATTDTPVPADYDGDGKTDIAVFRPSVGGWYIVNSSGAPPTSAFALGMTGDTPIPLNYIPTP